MPSFQPEKIFREFERRGVRYVLIGGPAATLHGSPLRTGDADVCPAPDAENLARLAAALEAPGARIRGAPTPEGVAFACAARFLSGVEILNPVTRFGDPDVVMSLPGTAGYEDLNGGAPFSSTPAATRADADGRGSSGVDA